MASSRGSEEKLEAPDAVDGSDDAVSLPETAPKCHETVVAAIIGAIVYFPFLLAIIIQSFATREAVDPAEWRDKLTGRAWGGGLALAALLLFSPLGFAGGAVPRDGGGGLAGAIVLLLVLYSVNFATVLYAWMRRDLRVVTRQAQGMRFVAGVSLVGERSGPVSSPTSELERSSSSAEKPRLVVLVDSPMLAAGQTTGPLKAPELSASARQLSMRGRTVLTQVVLPGDVEKAERLELRRPLAVLPCWPGTWRNFLATGVLLVDTLQLWTLALTTSATLMESFRELVGAAIVQSLIGFRDALLTFGTGSTAEAVALSSDDAAVTAALALGVTGTLVYASLCGVFIALDLGVQAALAPVLFSLFAGALFVTITSTLTFVIANSTDGGRVAAAFICLAYYSATGVFVSIYRSDRAAVSKYEVRTVPLFLGVERTLKGLLAILYTLLGALVPASSVTRGVLTAVVLGMLALGVFRFRPVSVHLFNMARATALALAAVVALLGAVLDSAPPGSPSSNPARAVLGLSLGTALLAGGFFTLHPFAWICDRRRLMKTAKPRVLDPDETPQCFLCATCFLPRGVRAPHEHAEDADAQV